MKRTIIFTVLALCAAALVSAQGMGRPFPGAQWGWNSPPAEAVTVSGTLTITEGTIAVTSGETNYLVPGLFRFVGFIDSFKEGASVTVEGYAADRDPDGKTKILRAIKLTSGGKDYEVGRPFDGAQPMPGYGGYRGRGGGWQGGCGAGGYRFPGCGRW